MSGARSCGESATCNADCTVARCGDGKLNVTAGEHCDDGNRNPFDGCTNDCTMCGDGKITSPEECDDGNTSNGDDCDAQCRLPRVVGDRTPESCTEAEFAAALAERSVRFACGPDPVTITLTSEQAISADTIIDGGGLITPSGGGAVRIFTVDASAVLDVRNLTIADGHTEFSGGGIDNWGTLTLTNCTLSGNSAVGGGGIAKDCYAVGPPLGGCWCNGPGVVTNSTFSGNGAHAGAGAIDGGCRLPASVTNSIIANSIGANCVANVFTDGGHNLQWPGTSCGETIPSLDPLLDPSGLKDNGGPTQTIAMLAGSPAIDAGDPQVCANPPVNGLDQRGYVRPGAGYTNCSIGAYEYNSPDPPPVCGNGNLEFSEQCDDGNVADGDCCTATCEFEIWGSRCGIAGFCDGAGQCAPCVGD